MITKVLCLLFSLAITFSIIVSIIYFVNRQDAADRRNILSAPGLVKGIVLVKRSYKGKGMTIRYRVDTQDYRLNTWVKDSVFKHFDVGDSIPLLYWVHQPGTAVIRFRGMIN